MKKICIQCQLSFEAKRATAKFCSNKCKQGHKNGQNKLVEPVKLPVLAFGVDPIDDNSDGLFIDEGVNLTKYKPKYQHVIKTVADVTKQLKDIQPPHGLKGGGLSDIQLAIRKSKLGF